MGHARRYALLGLALAPLACDGGPGPTEEPPLIPVTVTAWGEGSGRLLSAPYVDCRYDGVTVLGACEALVPAGTTLRIEAFPGDTTRSGPAFERWAGDCSSPEPTVCVLEVGESPRTASAGFPAVTHLFGRVFVPAGTRAELADLEVTLKAGGLPRGAVSVDARGVFDGAVLGSVRGEERVEIVLDARRGTARALFPTYVALRPWRLADPLKLVAIPLRWTIPSGTRAGEEVEIDVNEGLGMNPAFYQFTGRQPLGQLWEFQVQSVTLDHLPLRLAFDVTQSTSAVLNVDVDRYWRRVDELETVLGVDLFKTATDPAQADIVVGLRSGFCGNATACTSVGSGDPYLSGRAQIYHTSTEQFREGRRIVAHELIHALGMGHTCRWVSIMSLSDEECDRQRYSTEVTAQDAAYILVALHVATLQVRESMAPFGGGLFGAWNGQRIFFLGKEAWLPTSGSGFGSPSRVWDGG